MTCVGVEYTEWYGVGRNHFEIGHLMQGRLAFQERLS